MQEEFFNQMIASYGSIPFCRRCFQEKAPKDLSVRIQSSIVATFDI